MSRIGKRPVIISKGIKVTFENKKLAVSGPKGQLEFVVPEKVDIEISEGSLQVIADYHNDVQAKTMMGTTQATITNMVIGVSKGFTKQLNLVGVGYRAALSGNVLELSLGFSHPVKFELPTGIKAVVPANTQIRLESCDKQLLGQVAANIRKFRPPEPYKGKGIIFDGEKIRRKVGKTGKK
ncbi:MAG: 50S ribosomal protein L6 [SAR324 cluster bacterium]|nr:50S ribosomal protein L6 [SAR324 cluster bacterium]